MTLRQWSSEITTAEFREIQATSLCLSRDGGHGLLSGRRHLALLDMDQPTEVVKKVSRINSRWEVVVAQWNPGTQFSSHVALASNDRIEIYVWDNCDFSVHEPIRGHTRQVSDMDWNTKDPAILATSSLDGNIHMWDIRDMKKPCQSFQTIVGASHIRWSKGDSQFLASAHEGDIKLWDTRNDSTPLTYLSPHISRVHSIDWSYTDHTSLVTASNDCTVKFHTLSGKVVESTPSCLSTSVPVWRARFTPFGDGMVTVLVPHFGAHEHSLFLWNKQDLTSPVHTFIGHRDVILDFEWRRTGGGPMDYQMVTWSKDQSLRTWALDPETQYRCGVEDLDSDFSPSAESINELFDQATEAIEEDDNTIDGDEGSSDLKNVKKVEFAGLRNSSVKEKDDKHESPVKEHSPESTIENILQQEFALLDTNFSYVQVTDRDLDKRVCKIVATTAHSRLFLLIVFPPTYPVNTPPIFSFLKGSSMNPQNKSKILKTLQENSSQQVRRNRACLEICLRQLDLHLDQINQEAVVEDEATKNSFPFVRSTDLSLTTFGAFPDTCVPYPRTSGASFCSNGLLVCFGRPAYQIQVSQGMTEAGLTPRAYSAYLTTMNSRSEPDILKSNTRYGLSVHTSYQDKPRFTIGSEFGQSQESGGPSLTNTINRGRFKVKRVPSGGQEDGFLKSRRNVIRPRGRQKDLVSLNVTIYNISPMLPINRDLAVGYMVLDDPVKMCLHNGEVADNLGRSDLAHSWNLAAQVALSARQIEDLGNDKHTPWSSNPMGKQLISSLLDHHMAYRDFQMVALLICVFTDQTKLDIRSPAVMDKHTESLSKDKFWFLKAGALTGGNPVLDVDSPYHTIHGQGHNYATVHGLQGMSGRTGSAGNNLQSLENIFVKKNNRSNSWADACQDDAFLPDNNLQSPTQNYQERPHGKIRYGLLDSQCSNIYKTMLESYCDALYKWGLLEKRTSVSKHGTVNLSDVEIAKVGTSCATCDDKDKNRSCTKPNLICGVCRLPVTGLAITCPSCGHGGHLIHYRNWFQGHSLCPANCGCNCKKFLL